MSPPQAFICDAVRTPIGRYGGALSSIRTDDLAAIPLKVLMERNSAVDWNRLDDVLIGCANQAGEDNRNVARMALLLAGLPVDVPGMTINRLCGSGLDAVGTAARAIRAGEVDLVLAGGVESMSRAPFVMGKAAAPFARSQKIEDTTMGWRFVNPHLESLVGVDSMPETAENVARQCSVSRDEQDAFALQSQERAARAQVSGRFDSEIVPVGIRHRNGAEDNIAVDEHPRKTSLGELAALRPVVAGGTTVTAGNASGINDGAAALIIASEAAIREYGLEPRCRILAMSTSGVEPRLMGLGPVPAVQKLLRRCERGLAEIDVIELNEAFAAQAIAVARALGLDPADPRINPNGGAIALGHPLGMSGARLALTVTEELQRHGGSLGLATMCIGVGQGIAMLLERT